MTPVGKALFGRGAGVREGAGGGEVERSQTKPPSRHGPARPGHPRKPAAAPECAARGCPAESGGDGLVEALPRPSMRHARLDPSIHLTDAANEKGVLFLEIIRMFTICSYANVSL